MTTVHPTMWTYAAGSRHILACDILACHYDVQPGDKLQAVHVLHKGESYMRVCRTVDERADAVVTTVLAQENGVKRISISMLRETHVPTEIEQIRDPVDSDATPEPSTPWQDLWSAIYLILQQGEHSQTLLSTPMHPRRSHYLLPGHATLIMELIGSRPDARLRLRVERLQPETLPTRDRVQLAERALDLLATYVHDVLKKMQWCPFCDEVLETEHDKDMGSHYSCAAAEAGAAEARRSE